MSKENTPTPHNAAKYGDIAETVIMSGDPLRAKFIADNYIDNPVLYNDVRGMLGYTGTYKGKRVSVQGHGMGIPSMGIYSYELFRFYDVQKIIRVGTCGATDPNVPLGSLVLARNACSDSNYGYQYDLPPAFTPACDYDLMQDASAVIKEKGLPCIAGTVLSSDVFYDDSGKQLKWGESGIVGIEMEAYALYLNATVSHKKALTILTVTDNLIKGEHLSSEDRQTGLRNMIEIALELI